MMLFNLILKKKVVFVKENQTFCFGFLVKETL